MMENRAIYGPDHEELRRSVRKFFDTELMPNIAQWEEDGIIPREMWRKAGAMGILCPTLGPEYGGAGGDFLHLSIIDEELGYSGQSSFTIQTHTDIVSAYIEALGTEEQKQRWLPKMVTGEMIGAVAMTEPHAGSDLKNISTSARREGDEYVIKGSKTYITNGSFADFIVLAVRTGGEGHGGISLVLFPTDTPGFKVGRKLDKLGTRSVDSSALSFEDCRIPQRYLLGQENAAFFHIMQNFQGERLVGALTGTAGAQLVLDDTIRYVQERNAFGRPLVGFQVVRHQLVDCETDLELWRTLNYHAADLFGRGIPCQREISMAKLVAAEKSMQVVDRCLQLHGGMGYAEEGPVARAWRDARLLRIGGGASEIMKEIISKCMGF